MNMMFRPLVYVAGRFQNEPRNQRKIERCIKELIKLDEDVIFFSPVTAFGFLYEVEDYEIGLNKCLQMLSLASAMVIVKDGYQESTGVKAEMQYCKEHKIPMYFYDKGTLELIK